MEQPIAIRWQQFLPTIATEFEYLVFTFHGYLSEIIFRIPQSSDPLFIRLKATFQLLIGTHPFPPQKYLENKYIESNFPQRHFAWAKMSSCALIVWCKGGLGAEGDFPKQSVRFLQVL